MASKLQSKVWLFHLKSRVEENVSPIVIFYFVIDESARALVVAIVLLPGIWFLVFSFVKRVEAMREEAPRAKKMLRKKI